MDKLKEELTKVTKGVKLLTLKKEFEMLRMKEGVTVKMYSAKLVEIVNKIRLFGDTFPNSEVVEKMMISLPARFESKISAIIEESCDLKTSSVAELIRNLLKMNQLQQHYVQQVNFTEESENNEEGLFMASHVENTTNKSSWFIDSGCTSHLSNNELFHTLDKPIKTKVRMRNGKTVDALGKGSVSFQTKQGTKFIYYVVYVPCLASNLLSVAQMMSK
ncbi:hypothetical protein KY284_036186 [Solanum tuberosum]|nr:hypothetical protein KY284_036186 [Solanum tuberosum]